MLRLVHLTRQVARPLWCRVSVSRQPLAVYQQWNPQWQQTQQQHRCWYSDKSVQLTDGEKAISDKLKSCFPGAKSVEVSDISGGCGAMYQISIEAEEFRGKKTVVQHRLVNEALTEEIKTMHGLQLNTKVPSES